MNLWRYYDHKRDRLIEIRIERKPGPNSKPKGGAWNVRELNKHRLVWEICFEKPQIEWSELSKFSYLGSTKAPPKWQI